MERGHEIKVLDHGYVRLVDHMGSDEAIVEAARMSTGRGFVSWEPYKRCKTCQTVYPNIESHSLICEGHAGWEVFPRGDLGMLEFMYKNHHSTPFEFGELHIEVQAPLMVFREWHRHRTQSYSEFSARYSQMQDLHYVPALERFCRQSKTNKQGSGEAVERSSAGAYRDDVESEQRDIYVNYEHMLNEGVAKEIARINTPVSRYSKMRAKTDLRNWLGFLMLRKAPNAQWEIRQYADAVGEMVKAIWPRAYELFAEHDLYGTRLSRSEMRLLRQVMKIGEFAGKGYELTDEESEMLRRIEKKLGDWS